MSHYGAIILNQNECENETDDDSDNENYNYWFHSNMQKCFTLQRDHFIDVIGYLYLSVSVSVSFCLSVIIPLRMFVFKDPNPYHCTV